MQQKPNTTALQRKLGLFPVTNIVIANMIGAGIFTTSGLLMRDLGNPLLMLGLWFVGGVIALCGALAYSELGAAIPQAGGEYIFLSKLYHPLFGFLSGWVSFIVGFSAPIAASSIGFSEYFFRAFPGLLLWGNSSGISDPVLIKKLFSVLVITIFTLIHVRGIEFGAKVQNVLTILKVGLIIGLLGLGFSYGNGDFHHITQSGGLTLDFGGWKTIGLSLMWIMFAYSGWNASTYIGSEIKDPVKNLPRSLLFGTAVVLLLYLGLNILYLYAVNPADMKGVISIGGLAAGHLFGNTAEQLFSVLISFALFSSLSAFIILGPRVYYAMARDGYFFKFAAQVHHKFKVPVKAVVLQGIISGILVLSGTFDQILTYMGFSLGIFPLLAVLSVFKLRKSKKFYKMPGYPLAPIIYLLFGVSMLVLTCFERPVESSVAVGTVLIGLPAFWLFKNQR
ncbi:amino acid permease [candidate division KSB1 bacterium]|nr:amino acid permease [candidate division KSB1 bacterium]